MLSATLLILTLQTAPLGPEMTPFVIPWDDAVSGTATDVSFLNVKPAGKNGRIVVRNGRFVEEKTGARVRFFATNIGARAAFPTRADATKIAKRLAKHGINLVRFHHLQNEWDRNGGTIWVEDKMHMVVDPKQLDKLDFFIAALKREGIYSNINLQTSRNYQAAQGLPASVDEIKQSFRKKVDKFWPRMIALQKSYAKDVLDRRNPHTGLRYKDDPAIMKVEINNENSLVGWPGESPGAGLDALPEPFRGELVRRWNAYLKRRYGNDAALRKAWDGGSVPLGAPMLSRTNTWTSENQSQGEVSYSVLPNTGSATSSSTMVVQLDSNRGPDWHCQAHLPGLNLRNGQVYTVSFRARSDRSNSFGLTVNLDQPDWRNVGLNASGQLGTDWRTYRYTFKAQSVVPNHVRIAFILGNARGRIEIAEVSLRPGAVSPNLEPGESLSRLNIGLPRPGITQQFTDYGEFLTQLETAYSTEMRRYLRQDLGFTKTNIIDSQIQWGGTSALVREAAMEFADSHAYWEHPTFTGSDWDPKNWYIGNTPMTNRMDGDCGELGSLARVRVAGKPFSVSEYNHPAPSDFQVETMPLLATFACLQDWDAIYTFDYGLTGSGYDNDRIQGFFAYGTNPAKMGFFSSAALIFRQGLVPPLPGRTTLELNARRPWAKGWQFWDAWANLAPSPLQMRTAVRAQPNVADRRIRTEGAPVRSGTPANSIRHAGGVVYTAATPAAFATVGFTAGREVRGGGVSIRVARGGPRFSALTVTPTDGKPLKSSSRILIAACGRAENPGMVWNAARNSVSDQWGTAPAHIETVSATLTLAVDGPRRVYALDPSGRRKSEIRASYQAGNLTFSTQRTHQTMWWEVAKGPTR